MVIKMKVVIGTDHNGTNIKKEIIRFLNNRNIEVVDKDCESGILLCGTGIGMSIAANKVKGIRCAHVTSKNDAILARQHNNANMIALGVNSNKVNDLIKMIDLFLTTDFKNEERHVRRNNQIHDYEMENN